MSAPQAPSFPQISLVQAALKGEMALVDAALHSGEDVNVLSADGRTTIACAITGDSWESIEASFVSGERLAVLCTLAEHPQTSLYTLNAPQAALRGVTPLGFAAWLGAHEAVQVLLEHSKGRVCVDGMDAHGATALMYAARDGSSKVIQSLIAHCARPDFRDVHHRSSIQFALPHHETLAACERALRQQRWLENEKSSNPRKLHPLSATAHQTLLEFSTSLSPLYQPASNGAASDSEHLVDAVLSSSATRVLDILLPQSVSHPPVLVNAAGPDGLSPIHHCASATRPSVEILDLLFRYGADVSLFAYPEQRTPLHYLAANAHARQALYDFTVHLVRDLRAPLGARDQDEETPIHVAAENGDSLEVLSALLDCDKSGVREYKNSRGLTAAEVCKPKFRWVFGVEPRSASVASFRTIRPVSMSNSLLSPLSPDEQTLQPWAESAATESSLTADRALGEFSPSTSTHRLIKLLHSTSPTQYHTSTPAHLAMLDMLLRESAAVSAALVKHFRTRAEGAREALASARGIHRAVDARLLVVAQAVADRLFELSEGLAKDQQPPSRASSTINGARVATPSTLASPNPDLDDEKHALADWEAELAVLGSPRTEVGTARKLRSWWRKHVVLDKAMFPRLHGQAPGKDQHEMLSPPPSPTMSRTPSARRVRARQTSMIVRPVSVPECPATHPLRGLTAVLACAGRDMVSIEKCLDEADERIEATYTSILKAEKLIMNALQAREGVIERLKLTLCSKTLRLDVSDDTLFTSPPTPASASSSLERGYFWHTPGNIDSLPSPPPSTISSGNSSTVSLTSTLASDDDEDTRALQRLLRRRVCARVHAASEELERATAWLAIIKECVRGVAKQASL